MGRRTKIGRMRHRNPWPGAGPGVALVRGKPTERTNVMKNSLVMLSVLPLALWMAGCDGAPEGEEIGEVAGAMTIVQPPITSKIPIPTLSFSALIDFDNAPAG